MQGIGFRPFIYKEALRLGLAGHVLNHSSGVTIEAEGEQEAIAGLIEAIKTSPPPFADIHSVEPQEIEPKGERTFEIIESRDMGTADTLISADIATCDECLRNICDQKNRRFEYPFTNCTNCGPRYTIIEGIPYDRPKTSMKSFKMCPECEAEYKNPLDRRYHAQPNCCPVCGPSLEVRGAKYEVQSAISDVIKYLSYGKIVAIKGLGGFHLAVDATNEGAVLRLRKRKMRDEKPFAVMMPDPETVRLYCELSHDEEKILTSPQRPIVLLRKKVRSPKSKVRNQKIAEAVAPNNCYLGVMLPYTPLHHLLFLRAKNEKQKTIALVMTSANISDEPICYKNDEAIERLKDIADYFLLHNRDIYIRTDDSITRVMNGRPLMIRRARGYTPQPIAIGPKYKAESRKYEILSVGAELKNTICLLKGGKAFISHHIGNLENSASYEAFEQAIDHLSKIFDIKPSIIAHDMHPEYFSTKWAFQIKSFHPQLIAVQHHHAHIASCMAENRIDGPVIGIALDGTGYGTDSNIWGGEILIADYKDFRRAGHFEYIPLPGGDAAIKNPWQVAVAYSVEALKCPSVGFIKDAIPALNGISDEKIGIVLQMIEKRVNTPLTSSCGRFFDAAASILGIRNHVNYEGQAALELEMLASRWKDKVQGPKTKIGPNLKDQRNEYYPFLINKNNLYITICYVDTIKAIIEDLKQGVEKGEIAYRFHNTIAAALTEAVLKVSSVSGIRNVALSGGCFQNILLSEKLKKSLEGVGFSVYTHSLVPPNDGGISLGQAAIARARVE